jgi:hypothetical protein
VCSCSDSCPAEPTRTSPRPSSEDLLLQEPTVPLFPSPSLLSTLVASPKESLSSLAPSLMTKESSKFQSSPSPPFASLRPHAPESLKPVASVSLLTNSFYKLPLVSILSIPLAKSRCLFLSFLQFLIKIIMFRFKHPPPESQQRQRSHKALRSCWHQRIQGQAILC